MVLYLVSCIINSFLYNVVLIFSETWNYLNMHCHFQCYTLPSFVASNACCGQITVTSKDTVHIYISNHFVFMTSMISSHHSSDFLIQIYIILRRSKLYLSVKEVAKQAKQEIWPLIFILSMRRFYLYCVAIKGAPRP